MIPPHLSPQHLFYKLRHRRQLLRVDQIKGLCKTTIIFDYLQD